MARDFTDYVVEIHCSGERVYHQAHIRQLPKDEPVEEYEFNGRIYHINKDRAIRVPGSYHPWRLWDRSRPLYSLREIIRSKKIGVIKYREPSQVVEPVYQEVERKVPVGYSCKICAEKKGEKPFTTEQERYLKAHVTRKHRGAKAEMVTLVEYRTEIDKVLVKEVVEPFHMSRMHQPSGRMES